MPTIKIALSPCPNDTFCISPWVEGLIDAPPLELSFFDIETLNQYALEEPDAFSIIKVSSALLPQLIATHRVLSSGAAFGTKAGPLLVATQKIKLSSLFQATIAIPGKHTSAAFALRKLLPHCSFLEMPYEKIISSLLQKRCDAGLLIHESRFNVHHHGLVPLLDVAAMYKKKTGQVLPLGLFLARRTLDTKLLYALQKALYQSTTHAFERKTLSPLTCQLAKEMDKKIVQTHIDHYVTEETVSLSSRGIKALLHLFHP